MKQGILAAAFLVASAGIASADYIIIVANVAGGRELTATGAAGMNNMGGMQGMRPGMGGMQGMQGGPPGGMQGMRPGMPGGGGRMPPGGMQGNQGGPPPGMGSGPMMGMRGGPGGPGGGMMGNRGPMPMAGGMMGMMGMMGVGTTDADDISDYVIAVVEVKAKNLNKKLDQNGIVPVLLPERLGRTCQLLRNPSFGEMFVITETKDKADKPIPTVLERFNEKLNSFAKEKPTVSDLLNLAEWTLEHGLVDKYPEIMNKVVEADKGHSAAVAYVKVKAELDRKPAHDPMADYLRKNLLTSYKLSETPHYLLVHNAANDTAAEVKTHGDHLENAFRGFYYWFALRGITLTVPQNRQVVVLTTATDDYDKLHKILTSGPTVVDGFFARRENLAVMHSQRQDDPYKALNTFWDNWKSRGYMRFELLQNKSTTGIPRDGVPANVRQGAQQGDLVSRVNIVEAQMLALMLKALEQEAELATVSHDASRQLLFASGLLPRNVAAPEWILFGMGSFFETPLQSPWPTIGAPSPYYLPRWRELKSKDPNQGGLEKSAVDTLKKVVTDGYFRSLPTDSKSNNAEHVLHESVLRKARTVSWSLAYFLAQKHLDGLRHYFAELSKMPRDIELDDTILLGCFARAFGCVDGNNKVDEGKLKALANDWYSFWQSVHFESEVLMKEIREKIAKKVKEDEEKAQSEQNNAQQGQGGFPGGFAPGMNPQQGGPQRPGAPQPPGGPQQGRPPQGGGRVPPGTNPQQGGRPQPPGTPPPNNPGKAPPQGPSAPKQ
jgi:hypothetical protein